MTSSQKSIESEKLFAEKINGIAAIVGLTAAIGFYLTTGQIIPGIF